MPIFPKLGSRIVLRSPNWLGDAVMTLPAVQALLSRSKPDTFVSVLSPAKLADFWKRVPGLDSVLIVDENIAITADTLKPHHFESAILFPNSLRSAVEPWMAGIPKRYGYKGHNRLWILSEVFEKPSRASGYRHQKFDYLDLVNALSTVEASTPDALPFVPLPPPTPAFFPGSYLVICPGAEYGAAKRWPVERYASAVNELCSKRDFPVVILGSATDIPVARELAGKLDLPPSRLRNLTGETSLAEFLNLIAHASLVLCNDSGSMHVAAAFGTQAVALFGSTEPKLTGPITESVHVLRHHVPCSPCFLRECPIDFRCMKTLEVPVVVRTAAALFPKT